MNQVVLGTRGSALAVAQAEIVRAALLRASPALEIRLERITTTGDVRVEAPLSQLGRGVFVTQIETALRAGAIDFAVHSAKDLPSTLADDLTLAAFLPRADARDVVVSRAGALRDLPDGARVGTSSPRRACLLRAINPRATPVDVRGNVDTRLRKLRAGEYDALILAAAGLIRLGRAGEITEWLDPDVMIPSVGQGAVAVEARADDERIIALLRGLDDADTRRAVTAERAFLAELGAGCRAAAGAHATVVDGRLRLIAFVGGPEGHHVRARRDENADSAVELGVSTARALLRGGGAEFLARPDGALRLKRVAITRPEAQSLELISLLRANGAEPVSCPTVEIAAVSDPAVLDAALNEAREWNWIVFTSANAVNAVADRLSVLSLWFPGTVLLAAVGASTAAALARRIRAPDFTPSRADAETLAAELPVAEGTRVLFPRSDLSRETLTQRLTSRGARVRDVVAYRTMASPGARELAALVRGAEVDAIVFASPSAIRFATGLRAALEEAGEAGPAVVCIGPTTSRTARDAGVRVDAEAAAATVGGIVEAVERALGMRHTDLPQLARR